LEKENQSKDANSPPESEINLGGTKVDDNHSNDSNVFTTEQDLCEARNEGNNLEKMIMSTGIKVDTHVKTKFIT